jgi:CubicO group peptidase (beta-lactamase class C family)
MNQSLNLVASLVREVSQRGQEPQPGAAIAVLWDGRMIDECCCGSANIENRDRITPATSFRLGSISKQFTATAAALMIDAGRISPTDDIRKFIPELPDYGHRIEVQHLVYHTAGIRDFNSLMRLANRNLLDIPSQGDVLELLCRQPRLNFVPGTEYSYSNSGYLLLGLVVERAAGTTFGMFCENEIFDPLRMSHASVDARYEDGRVRTPSSDRAKSYMRVGGRWAPIDWHGALIGASGIRMSLCDLHKWDANLRRNTLGRCPERVAAMLNAHGRLADGRQLAYGWGQCIAPYHGLRAYFHRGTISGVDNAYIRFPEDGLSVIVLSNHTTPAVKLFVSRIVDAYLGHRTTSDEEPWDVDGAPAADSVAATTNDDACQCSGRYYSSDIDAMYELSSRDGRVVVTCNGIADEFYFFAPDRCAAPHRRIAFKREPAGDIVAFTVSTRRTRDVHFGRVS